MSKRTAFIGLSGPMGYDYLHVRDLENSRDSSNPNPVLENVSGLLICYDELIFLSRHFCPTDMQQLPYVKFAIDLPQVMERLVVAREQFGAVASEIASFDYDRGEALKIAKAMTLGQECKYAIDHHTHGLHLDNWGKWYGSAADLRNVVLDLGMSAALKELLPGRQHLDTIINSPATRAINSNGFASTDVSAVNYERLALANELVAVSTPNVIGPMGSYHESLEDLRNHPQVCEFRSFLAEVDASGVDGRALAKEVSSRADAHVA